MDFFKLVAELGFPIAAAFAAGYFVFLTLKFILAGVTSSVNGMGGHALGLQPDYDRISRAEQADQRKD